MTDITDRCISSWNLTGARPTITGDALRSPFEITGFQVGDQTVHRGGDPLYLADPFSTSLISRTMAACGTAQPWTALYS